MTPQMQQELLDALVNLRQQLHAHFRLDVKKHYSLMVADSTAGKAIHNAQTAPAAEIAGNPLRTPLVEKIVAQCGDDLWGSCKQFSKDDWKQEVENSDSVLGYWEWVAAQAEANGIDLDTLEAGSRRATPGMGG